MKKLILSLLATAGVALLLPASVMAAGAQSDISGTVLYHGNPVKGATVSVACNGIKTKTAETGKNGSYLITFGKVSNCPNGSTAVVTATWGSLSGSNSGAVNDLTADLNVAVVNVSVVPEFGLITGASALTFGGGAFILVRRRNLANEAK